MMPSRFFLDDRYEQESPSCAFKLRPPQEVTVSNKTFIFSGKIIGCYSNHSIFSRKISVLNQRNTSVIIYLRNNETVKFFFH